AASTAVATTEDAPEDPNLGAAGAEAAADGPRSAATSTPSGEAEVRTATGTKGPRQQDPGRPLVDKPATMAKVPTEVQLFDPHKVADGKANPFEGTPRRDRSDPAGHFAKDGKHKSASRGDDADLDNVGGGSTAAPDPMDAAGPTVPLAALSANEPSSA